MSAITQNPLHEPRTPASPLHKIAPLTILETAPMSLYTESEFIKTIESNRAQIIAAMNLLDAALKNEDLLLNLQAYLPACTCGSIVEAVYNFREYQWEALADLAEEEGLILSAIGDAPEKVVYTAHEPKWGITKEFKNLDEFEDWFFPICHVLTVARQDQKNLNT